VGHAVVASKQASRERGPKAHLVDGDDGERAEGNVWVVDRTNANKTMEGVR